jgi:hypothetical protein
MPASQQAGDGETQGVFLAEDNLPSGTDETFDVGVSLDAARGCHTGSFV